MLAWKLHGCLLHWCECECRAVQCAEGILFVAAEIGRRPIGEDVCFAAVFLPFIYLFIIIPSYR